MNGINKIYKSIISALIMLTLVSTIAAPVYAWGSITHAAIDSKLTNVPKSMTTNPAFTKGGGISPDMFYFVKGEESYSILAHSSHEADLGRKMLSLAGKSSTQQAFAYGWLTHDASDIVGHTRYVVPIAGTDSTLHSYVEIGVDANLVSVTPLSFSVPYLLIQNAYKSIYGQANTPSYDAIVKAAQTESAVIYTEKTMIKLGLFNNFKHQYNNFRPIYKDSIDYSIYIVNNPSKLPNANLYTGSTISSASITPASMSQVSSDIIAPSKDMLDTGIIDVQVKDDKTNHYITISEPVVKNKKAFDDNVAKLMTKMKSKMGK
jgi:hypothetical protein